MARYIDADDLIRLIGIDALCYRPYSKRDAIACVKAIPTADVVPRERFDRVFGNLKAVLEERAEDKEEVAREIFWEMDKLLLSITIDEEAEESFVGFDFDKYIALKKKYTEAEPPEGDES